MAWVCKKKKGGFRIVLHLFAGVPCRTRGSCQVKGCYVITDAARWYLWYLSRALEVIPQTGGYWPPVVVAGSIWCQKYGQKWLPIFDHFINSKYRIWPQENFPGHILCKGGGNLLQKLWCSIHRGDAVLSTQPPDISCVKVKIMSHMETIQLSYSLLNFLCVLKMAPALQIDYVPPFYTFEQINISVLIDMIRYW